MVEDGIRAGGKAQLEGKTEGEVTTIAIPVENLVSLPVRVPGGDLAVAEGVAMTELEDLGVETPLKGDKIVHAGYLTRSLSDADPQLGWGFGLSAPPPFPEGNEIRYCPSPLLLPLPGDGVSIWKEFGRLVAAWMSGGHLVHCSPLTSCRLDRDLVLEVFTITQSLRDDGHFDLPLPVCFFGFDAEKTDSDFVRCAEEVAGTVCEFAEDLEPRLPGEVLPVILPTALAARLAARRRLGLAMIGIGSVFALLLMVLLALAGSTWWRKGRLDAREATLRDGAEDVQRVRLARERWQTMAGALEPDSFPIELLHQCVLLMPESGVRLTQFECGGGKLIVSGVATSARQALAYRDQFDRAGPLGVFRWTLPSPDILRDGQASFRAEGKSIYATDDF